MNFKENFRKFYNEDNKQELIKKLNLKNDRTLRNYINGTRIPNLYQLEIIVEVLKCSYDDLLK